MAHGLAASYGCTAEAIYRRGAPALVNHEEQTEVARAAARSLVGADAVTVIPPVTGAEDFALMLQQRPGAFMFLGAGTGSEGKSPEVHTPHYDFNDAIIPLGVAYWVGVVEQEMGSAAA